MDIARDFPFRRFISLEWRTDRRERLAAQFATLGFEAQWFPAIHAGHVGNDTRGFLSPSKRAVALSKRSVLREAWRSGAEAALILEDDVVFHPEFVSRLSAMALPADWALFFFGCQHIETPEPVAPGIVRVNRALDGQAWAVRGPYLRQVSAAMRGGAKGATGRMCSDVLLSSLHRRIPTYAAWPNLAWQAFDYSDVAGRTYSNYDPDGAQRVSRHIIKLVSTP